MSSTYKKLNSCYKRCLPSNIHYKGLGSKLFCDIYA